MTIATRELFVLKAELSSPQMMENTPFGQRKIVPVTSGTFTVSASTV